MIQETPRPDATRCPVGDCSFGEETPRAYRAVVAHVASATDDAHRRAARRHDWTYEYVQIE